MTRAISATKPRLFDDFERTDNCPIALCASFHSSINRFDVSRADQVCELCNCRFGDYARSR